MRYKNLRSHSLKVRLLVKPRYIGSNLVGVEEFALIEAGTVSINNEKDKLNKTSNYINL